MSPAFWDASALVPLCVEQTTSSTFQRLLEHHEIVVWWGTPVEVCSALERLLRMGELTVSEYKLAGERLQRMKRRWLEMQPSEALRAQAEIFLSRHSLRAADSLQLAAAWTWCSGDPQSCVFISGDSQLLKAAGQVGFQIVHA